MSGTLLDFDLQAPSDKSQLGTNGIVSFAPETVEPEKTYFAAGLFLRPATFTDMSGNTSTSLAYKRVYSVNDAVNLSDDSPSNPELIELFGDSVENVVIPDKKSVKLELNDKKLSSVTGKKLPVITVNDGGKLVLTDSGGTGSTKPGVADVVQSDEGVPAIKVAGKGSATIEGGEFIAGSIASDDETGKNVNIKKADAFFSIEPDSVFAPSGQGFVRARFGDQATDWYFLYDVKLFPMTSDNKVSIDISDAPSDSLQLSQWLINQSAQVRGTDFPTVPGMVFDTQAAVRGYSIAPTADTQSRFDELLKAIEDKNTGSFQVSLEATKESDDSTTLPDKVSISYVLINTQPLKDAIAEAEEALNNTTDKPKEVVDNLTQAKKDAEDALKASPTTQKAIDDALAKLKEALDAFNKADLEKADTSALEQKIKDANDALNQYPNKTDEAKKELNKAIKKAQSIVDSKPNKSQQGTVDQAVKDLQAAIDKYINSANKPTPGGNGGNGGGTVTPTPKTYTVTFVDNVSYTTDQTAKVTSGQKVTKPADPTLEGYVFKGWFTDAGLKQAYDFSKPVTGDLTLFAKWAYPVTAPKTFADVDQSAWYVPGINFVTSHGLMHGYGDGTYFGVGKQLTRGELASILMNFAAPGYGPEDFRDAKNETDLPDIADGQFYTAAANWAVKNGVINGYGNPDGSRTFGPNDPVTMEQLVAILANLADKEGPDKADTAVLAKFEDPASVSPWATKSVAWAIERGLIHGSGENGGLYLHGSANIMRERVATIFMNAFDEGILSFE